MNPNDQMNEIVSLCKRRGFVFQSSEIYGGLKSSYDYGHLGVELKRNIAQEWWKSMVYERDDIYGIDASIIMHPKVWKASGHLDSFTDPLVDCLDCKERFRPDKAPKIPVGTEVEFLDAKKKKQLANVSSLGVVCPNCNSPHLSDVRQFRGMFQTNLGPTDPIHDFIEKNYDKGLSKTDFIKQLNQAADRSAVYLRPETAQAMFVQFLNIQQTTSAKIPFGIAQIGKSFRNEVTIEHFIFRSCEFEQMEMEFFCEPGTQKEWMSYWTEQRLKWHQKFSNHPEHFRLRAHDADELAHYSDQCFDVEYKFPWGWDELEGIASRTDYDLKKHAEASGAKISYFDPNKKNPQSGKNGYRYVPYVIEPAAGLTRVLLSTLVDAYTKDKQVDAKGQEKTRVVLKLHPKLAPIKAAVLPLVKKDGQPEKCQMITEAFKKEGILVRYDDVSSIGKRYAKHDEIGTPYCLTVDNETLSDESITIRDRDTTKQTRLPINEAIELVKNRLQEKVQ